MEERMAAKKQKIRFELAQRTRANAAGAGRNTAIAKVQDKYHLSSDGIGGTRALARFYTGADYWV
jgi:hypothetical protein